jgi:hypothetical protein
MRCNLNRLSEQDRCSQTAFGRKVLKMKTGDFFSTVQEFELALGDNFPKQGFLVGGFIEHLTRHPDYSCAKQVFYATTFPNGTLKRWNEFEGITKADVFKNLNDLQWLLEKSKVVHEIYSPLKVPQKPGAEEYNYEYQPENIIQDSFTRRLIFGVFRGCNPQYVFLGVYELDKDTSLAFNNASGYNVDAVSFPSNSIVAVMQTNSSFSQNIIAAIQSNLITYPHCVWKRVSDEWGE